MLVGGVGIRHRSACRISGSTRERRGRRRGGEHRTALCALPRLERGCGPRPVAAHGPRGNRVPRAKALSSARESLPAHEFGRSAALF